MVLVRALEMRKILSLTVLGAAWALACSPARPSEAPAPAAPQPAAQPAEPVPQPGGTMTWVGYVPNPNLHPYKNNSNPHTIGTVGPAYETLVAWRFEPGFDFRVDSEVLPMLAERWEQPDRTTYLFNLRRGVRWHDGEELTAQDVVFSYEYARDPKNGFAVVGGRLRAADRIEAVDRYTVRITTKTALGTFLENLADMNLYILPKHTVDRGEELTRVANGTGPYKVESFNPTGSSVFVKNPNYWQPGKPYPDRLQVAWGVDDSARAAAFIAGKSDLYTAADRAEFEPVAASKTGLPYIRRTQDAGNGLLFKLDRPPFNDVRVRRAIHLAVDRDGMNKAAASGDGGINPPGVPGWKAGWAIPPEELAQLPGYRKPKDQDLAEARRLLAEAGYADGLKTTVLADSKRVITKTRMAEVMSAQLKQVGVELTLDLREAATRRKMEVEGEYETIMTGLGRDEVLLDYLHSRGPLNKVGLNDPKLDQLLEAIGSTFDVQQRKQVVLERQRYLLDQVYFVPTVDLTAYATWQPWVHGYNPSVNYVVVIAGQDTVNSFWLDREKMPADRR